MVDENSDALSDVPMITNPGDYGELPDCMIVYPTETLQEQFFDVSDLWHPNLPTPEVLLDILPPQSSCSSSSSVPVVVTDCAPLTDMTNTISPYTLAAAAHTASALAAGVGLTSQPLMTLLAGRSEGEDSNLKTNSKRSASVGGGVGGGGGGGVTKKKVVLDAEGNVVVVEKKPRAPKKQKKGKEEQVQPNPPAPPLPAPADAAPAPAAAAPPSSDGPLCRRETGRVSPISPMIGLTQFQWPRENKDDPPSKPQRIFHCKTARSIAVLF